MNKISFADSFSTMVEYYLESITIVGEHKPSIISVNTLFLTKINDKKTEVDYDLDKFSHLPISMMKK